MSRKPFLETLRVVAPVLILAVGVGGFLVFGQRPETPQRTGNDDSTPRVVTVVAEKFDGEFDVEAEGVAVPYRQETLSAQVAGRIVAKPDYVKSGNYLSKGDLLYEIDPTDYQYEVDRLTAQLEQSTEEINAVDVDLVSTGELLQIAEQQLELRDEEIARYQRAAKTNSVTAAEFEDARRQQLAARNERQTLKNERNALKQRKKTLAAAKKLVEVQLKQAGRELARTKVVADVAGSIVSTGPEVNDFVRVGDQLVRINDTSRAEVKCSILVDELYWIWLQSGRYSPSGSKSNRKQLFQVPQAPAKVVFPFQGIEYVWNGTVDRYEGTGLDEATRTVPIRVVVDDPSNVAVERAPSGDGPPLGADAAPESPLESTSSVVVPPTIFTGMYLKIRIPIAPEIELIEIPTAGLRPGDKVWVLRGGKLRIVPVHVARATGDDVLIRPAANRALQPGDRVVVSPLATVRDGMDVVEAAK